MDNSPPNSPGQTGDGESTHPIGLQRGAVGLFGDFVGAISDVAPTLDVGLTLAAFVIAVGLAGPSTILITGAAMLCVATGYARLNRAEPNAAAGVRWLQKIMPAFGFAMGLLVVLTITFILISNVSLMGSTVLSLFNSSLTSNAFAVWAVGAALVFLAIAIAVVGVRVQIRFQAVVVILEYAIVVICAGAILWAHASGRLSHAPHPALSWLSPMSATNGGLSAGIVLGVFTLGGWENPIYLAEEQRNATRDPGRAAYLGIIWGSIFIAFLMFAFQSAAPASELQKHAGNVLGYATGLVLPQPWPTLIDLALISSLSAGIQATASDGARTAFGMARERILPQVFGRVNPRYLTPSAAFIIIGIVVVAISGLYAASSGVGTILADVTSTAGFLYTIIYVAVALTSIWRFRDHVMASVRGFLTGAVIPLIGSAVLMYAFVKSLAASAAGVILPTVIVLAFSLALGFALQRRSRVPFFQGEAAGSPALAGLALGGPAAVQDPLQARALDEPPIGEHS
jgi:amino acid transporter